MSSVTSPNDRTNDLFNDIMWRFDLRDVDVAPERPEWQACKAELRRLIRIAYVRNHGVEGKPA